MQDTSLDELRPGSMPMPSARQVNSPWLLCQAARDGLRTAVFTATARDRTGLLFAMLDVVHKFDAAMNIDAGHAFAQEDYFTAFLLIRTREMAPRQLDAFIAQIRQFAAVPVTGWQIPVARAVTLSLRGADQPGLLREVCRVFVENAVNIRRFDSETSVTFAKDADFAQMTTPPDAQPICELDFDLELTAQADAQFAALQARLAQLGCEVTLR